MTVVTLSQGGMQLWCVRVDLPAKDVRYVAPFGMLATVYVYWTDDPEHDPYQAHGIVNPRNLS